MAYNLGTCLKFNVGARQFAVASTGTPVGISVYLFEYKADTSSGVGWQYIGDVGPTSYFNPSDFTAAINNAGGPVKYIIAKVLSALNALLKSLLGGSTGQTGGYTSPTSTTDATNISDVNAALANAFEMFTDTSGTAQIRVKAGY